MYKVCPRGQSGILLVDKVPVSVFSTETALLRVLIIFCCCKILLIRRSSHLERCGGFTGVALKWSLSYLSDRIFSVHLEQDSAPVASLSCEVPQRSLLNPILFSVYPEGPFLISITFGSIALLMMCKFPH